MDNLAVVIGASWGIGGALMDRLQAARRPVIGLSRRDMDLTDEDSIVRAAGRVARLGPPGLILVETGVLHGPGMQPEKTIRALDADAMARAFAVNAIEIGGRPSEEVIACVEDPATQAALDAQVADAQAADIRGTPTFFVNGKRVEDTSLEGLAAVIEPLLP